MNFPYKILSLLIVQALLCGCSSSTQKENDETASDTIEAVAADTVQALTPQGNPLEDAEAKVTKRGFIIAGEGPETRAFTAFRSTETITAPYIKLMSDYRKAFPDLNLYAVVIPGQSAYYVPKKVAESSKPVKPAFDYLEANLDSTVKYVDVYNILAAHTREPIFSRTDHHWAPLGAYYVAQELANKAGVPFKDLSNFDKHVVHGYVGSMFHYTGDPAIKNNPEDFYYYTPKDTEITTTYVTIKGEKGGPLSEGSPHKGEFFHPYSDGAGGAYCTFMGGDHYIVKVETPVENSRRLLVIKDSHGNPIPAYLFNSFEEIHVIDYRYFPHNLKKYVADNKISDIALAFGINTTSGSGNMQAIRNFLTQEPGSEKSRKDGK